MMRAIKKFFERKVEKNLVGWSKSTNPHSFDTFKPFMAISQRFKLLKFVVLFWGCWGGLRTFDRFLHFEF